MKSISKHKLELLVFLGPFLGYAIAILLVSHTWYIDENNGTSKKVLSLYPFEIEVGGTTPFDAIYGKYNSPQSEPSWVVVQRKGIVNLVNVNTMGGRLVQAEVLLVQADSFCNLDDQEKSDIANQFFSILREKGIPAAYDYASYISSEVMDDNTMEAHD